MKNPKAIPIRIGHSPDPDDAFMFYALANRKIDVHGFKIDHVIEDIESLNQRALDFRSTCNGPRATNNTQSTSQLLRGPKFVAQSPGLLEVTAVSCHAYAYLADQYVVMRSGASVGDGYGPILVKRATGRGPRATKDPNEERGAWSVVHGKKIAVPGKLTTAYLVLQLYERMAEIASGKNHPRNDVIARRTKADEAISFEPIFMPFDKILDAVKAGEADYGLIIHEGQITYEKHGLSLALDLGEWWHEHTGGLPLPLGIDVIRKDLGSEAMKAFARLFRASIEYALNHRKEALEYARRFGRGIAEDLNDRFVGMYVNDFTVDLGPKGEAGFRRLLDEAYQWNIIPKKIDLEFV